jgi:hypothetical protein
LTHSEKRKSHHSTSDPIAISEKIFPTQATAKIEDYQGRKETVNSDLPEPARFAKHEKNREEFGPLS